MDQSDQNNNVVETQTIDTNHNIKAPPKKRRGAFFVTLFLVFLIALSISFCYFHHRIKQHRQKLLNDVMSLQNKLAQQQLVIDAMQKNTLRLLPAAEMNFLLAERVYDRIASANILLLMKSDVAAALQQLLVANNLIANNVTFMPLKTILATDIANLQQAAAANANAEDIFVRLSDLSKSLIKLQQVAVPIKEVTREPIKNDYAKYPAWKRIFLAAKASVQNVVKIDDQSAAPFLPPKQLTNLIVNLQAEIIQAQWALMRGQNDFYRASLQNVATSLNSFFPQGNPIVLEAAKNLNELINIKLAKNLTINASLEAAQKILLNLDKLQK